MLAVIVRAAVEMLSVLDGHRVPCALLVLFAGERRPLPRCVDVQRLVDGAIQCAPAARAVALQGGDGGVLLDRVS